MRFAQASFLLLSMLLMSALPTLQSTDQPLTQPNGSRSVQIKIPDRASPLSVRRPDSGGDRGQAQDAAALPDADEVTLQFVREHQPELAKLLEFLKSKQSGDYRQAMNESAKVRQRLQTIKGRDAELYEVELAIWKNAAQLRLLAASLSVKAKKLGDQDRAKLEELIKRENELTIKRLQLEKARAESRLAQLSQQLTKRQEQSDNVVAKALKTWEHRIEKSGGKSKAKTTTESQRQKSKPGVTK